MSVDSVKQKPAPTVSSKPPSSAGSGAAAAQAAAAFAAHLKKNQTEQQHRAMRHGRRDGVGRMLAADESTPGMPALLTAGEDAVERSGERSRDQRQQHNDQSDQQEQAAPSAMTIIALDTADSIAIDELASQLKPVADDDGLFDVLRPDGSVLSVAVTRSPMRLSLLLSTTSTDGTAQLRRCRMELEQRLGRRMGKDVVIAVL